jgi:hypothetical protein
MREAAVTMASIFGLYFTILGIWIFFKGEELERYWTSFKANPGLFYLGGIFNLLFGLMILHFYHVWSWHMLVLVTILGYWILIKGLLILFFPKKFAAFGTKMVEKYTTIKWFALIPIALGIIFLYVAWF